MSLNSVLVKEYDREQLIEENGGIPTYVATAERYQETSAPYCMVTSSGQVNLDFEDLMCFEVVDRQFQKWGVIFNNCIAIRPSNPAFPPHSGHTVLMGAPKSGWLEAVFPHPVKSVRSCVTTSQKLVLSAYNQDNQLLTEVEISESNLALSDSSIEPNVLLTVTAADIYRVTYCAFDGQFILDDFKFLL